MVVFKAEISLGCCVMGRELDCGLDRDGKPGDLQEGQGIQRHTSPANHRIPHVLDAFRGKKIRRRIAERLPFRPRPDGGDSGEVNIAAVGTVIVAAMAAAKVVDRLSGEGFRGESGSRDDDLAVFVPVSGVGGLKSRHIYRGTACLCEPGGKFLFAEASFGEVEKGEICIFF